MDATAPYALADSKALNLLVTREFQPDLIEPIEAAYTTHQIYDAEERRTYLAAHGAEIEAVLTSGIVGLKADEIALMPNLKIVHVFAAGYENVDVPALKARSIMMCNVPGQNSGCVADHAMGLLIAVTRRFLEADAKVRTGIWDDVNNATPMVNGKKIGILGLGSVGREVAKRAQAFDMTIGYHTRKPRADVPHRYFDSVAALADWADYLVACTPGGAETRHIVNADILRGLGKQGYFINVARGTVADTDAIVAALEGGMIAGAALDVIESEPKVPDNLLRAPNLLLTPHGAGRAPDLETRRVQLIRTNIENHLTGRPVLTAVPEGGG